MLARRRHGRSRGRHEWPDAGPRAHDILATQPRLREKRIRGLEQIRDVDLTGADVVGRDIGERVGRADDRVRAGRERERDAAILGMQQRDGVAIADALAADGDVRALAALDASRRRSALELSHGIAPRSCGVDEHARADLEMRAREDVFDARDAQTVGRRRRAGEHRVVRDHRAESLGVEHVRERQPRVVGRGVEVAHAAAQLQRIDSRLEREHVARIQTAVALDVAKEREQVVERQPDRELPEREPLPPIPRPREREWMDEVWRDPEEPAPLRARFEHEMQVSVLEIPHAAVDQPRRTARRSAREIALVDEGHRQPA